MAIDWHKQLGPPEEPTPWLGLLLMPFMLVYAFVCVAVLATALMVVLKIAEWAWR